MAESVPQGTYTGLLFAANHQDHEGRLGEASSLDERLSDRNTD